MPAHEGWLGVAAIGAAIAASASVFAVVLPAERDAAIVQGEEPRVGDRDPMGVAG